MAKDCAYCQGTGFHAGKICRCIDKGKATLTVEDELKRMFGMWEDVGDEDQRPTGKQ